MLSEWWNTEYNLTIVFGLTRLWMEYTIYQIYHTPGEHANHNTTNALNNNVNTMEPV